MSILPCAKHWPGAMQARATLEETLRQEISDGKQAVEDLRCSTLRLVSNAVPHCICSCTYAYDSSAYCSSFVPQTLVGLSSSAPSTGSAKDCVAMQECCAEGPATARKE